MGEVDPANTTPAEPPTPASAPVNEYDTLLAQAPVAAATPKPAGNEYDGLVVDLAKERSQRLRATMVGAQGSTPDAAAKALDLSKKTGLPADIVERNLPKVEGDQKLNEYDAILEKSPKLGSWLLADQVNAKVAGAEGDFSKLGLIEEGVNELTRGMLNQQSGSGLAGWKVASRKLAQLDDALARQARGEFMTPFQREMIRQDPEIREAMREAIIQYGGQYYARQTEASEIPLRPVVAEMQKAGKEGDWAGVFSALKKDPLGAIYSISMQSAAMLPFQIGGMVIGGIPGAFGVSFLAEYMGAVGDALEQSGVNMQDPTQVTAAFANPELMAKVEGQAATKAATIAGFDAATLRLARVPMGVGKSAVVKQATNIPAQIAVQGAGGAAGEALGSTLAGLKVDPFAVVAEALGEMGTAPVEVVTTRWAHAVRQDATREQWEKFQAMPPLEQHATGTAMAIDRLVATANDTKMATASPAKLQEFIASVSAQDATVFIPVEAVMTYMQDMTGLQAQQFAERLGISEQLARIARTGEDVAVPLAMYVTGASEAHKAWRDQIRTEVDGFSIRQAQEFEKTRAAELKELQDRFEEQVQAGVVADPQTIVFQQVLAMARANGYTNDVAAQHAALYAAHYQARAVRNPTLYADALDAFEKAGPGTGMRVQTVLSDGTRVMGPDMLDAMLDSLRSGKDPIRLPRAKVAKVAREPAAALRDLFDIKPGGLKGVLPESHMVPETFQPDANIMAAARRLAMGWGPEKNAKKPQSLLEFVRKNGGLNIASSEAGNLRAADLGRIPGLLQRKKKGGTGRKAAGRSVDFVAQSAVDNGFRFGQGTKYGSGVDVDAFLNALIEDASGTKKHYPDDADTDAWRAQQAYFDQYQQWLKEEVQWEPKGRSAREVAWFLSQDAGTQRLMALAERIDNLGPDSSLEASYLLDAELAKVERETLDRLQEKAAERFEAWDPDLDESRVQGAESATALDAAEWEKLHGDLDGIVGDDEAIGRGADEADAGGHEAGSGATATGDVAAGSTPQEAARARRAAALATFQANRQELADALASMDLDITKMSNAQVRDAIAKATKEMAGARTLNQRRTDTEPPGPILLDTKAATPEEMAARQRARDKEAAEAIMRGRKRGAAGQEGADDLPLFGGERQRTLFQPVYHGGPHIFDRFSLDAIGTGEGAQAYGWGLYFAGKKEIAKFYRETLTKRVPTVHVDGVRVDQAGLSDAAQSVAQLIADEMWPSLETYETQMRRSLERNSGDSQVAVANRAAAERILVAIDELRGKKIEHKRLGFTIKGEKISDADNDGFLGAQLRNLFADLQKGVPFDDALHVVVEDLHYRAANDPIAKPEAIAAANRLEGLKPDDIKQEKPGRLYHVEIPEDGAYLHWDKPISEQSPEVKAALKKLGVQEEKPTPPKSAMLRRIVDDAIKANEGDSRDVMLIIDNDGDLNRRAKRYAEIHRADLTDKSAGEYIEQQAKEYLDARRRNSMLDGQAIYIRLTRKFQSEYPGATKGAMPPEGFNAQKEASLALRDAGIPGIQYLDASSRNEGDGTHNYVLFDDSLASITAYEQEARGSITFADNQTTISLFQARDLSTLAHETGHLWLAEMEHDAKQAGASEKAKADWQTVLTFLDSKGGYITREQHELFARAFETYLMEGKAPSEGLRAVFRSFKNWLVSIYRNLARLQAPISPEMREVFDRLIATDEEIAAAKDAQGFNPVFADAKSADMTETEFKAYTRRVTQVVDEAEQRVLEKVMASIRKQRTKEVAAEKAKIRGEVRDELMGDPGNAALHLLRNGSLYAGETPALLKDAKLARPALVAMLGNDGLQRLPRGIYAEEGIDPEDLAQVFGLGNGQELVERLMQIQAEQDAMRAKGDTRSPLNARIAEETQRRLTESLGDPLNDGSIEAEAMAAVHSDKQGALLSSELKVLARKAGHSGAITLDDLKTWAANTIGEMSVYQATQVSKFQRAERMAGQAVQRALIKGDFVAAFKSKQDQLVNFALYREAKKAADDAEAVRKLADRYASAETIKSMDQGALDQIHQLLEAYDFKKRSGKLLAERTTFSMWAAEQAAAGFEVIEPPRLQGAGSRHYSQMTMEEIRGVGDTIKQIAHIGRWKQEMLDGEKKRAFEALVDEAVETAGRIDQRGVSLMRRGTSALQDTLGDVGSWFRSVDAALLKMETIFEWLDGDKTGRGVFSRVIFRRIAQAQVDERDRQKDLAARFAAVYDKVPKDQRKAWPRQHVVPELGAKLNKSQMIAVALNTGNASNLQKMLQGEDWDEGAVRAMLDKHLTREEWQFVQDTWDLIDSLWPETEAMEKRVNGVAPPKVEAIPVETPYGTLRGGYYPMAYDKHGDIKADRIAAMGAEGLFDPEYRRASTRAGSTNKRVEGFNAKVLLSLNVIGSHLNEVAHDLAYREAVMDAYKFLSNDKVREAIRSAVGAEYEKQSLHWLKAVANEWAIDRRGLEGIDKFLQGARANTAIVGMGFRVSTMLSQTAGFANSVQRLGSANMLRGMRDFYKDPMGMAAVVRGKSGEMRHRANDLERDIRLALKRLEGKNTALDNVRRFAFRGIALFDAMVSLPTWMGAYNDGLKQGMSEADAVAYGDKMVRDTQGAGSVKDLSAIQRGGEALKLFAMFYSYFNVYYNRQRSLVRDARDADSFSDYMDVVAQGFWLMIVPTLLAALLSGQGPDDEEEWWAWAVRNVGFGVFSGIPWARDVSNAISNQIAGKGFGGAKLSPIQGIGEGIQHLFTDAMHVAKGEDTSKSAIKNVFNVGGLFTGLPTGQLGASLQFVWDVLAEGSENPENLLDWMKGLAYGPKHKK